MSKKIFVKKIISLDALLENVNEDKEFKIHFARHNGKNAATHNGGEEPLDVFLRSEEEYKGWQEYKNKRKRFFKYIFTLAKFYHENDTWLFTGIYKVNNNDGEKHEVERLSDAEEFIGRLKILHEFKDMKSEVYLKNHFDSFEVKEIYKERFVGREFSNYENVHLSFSELETIYANEIQSWKTSLQNIKGIYLITDKTNGKKYVGAAYKENIGVWSRWGIYRKNGHGNNAQLSRMIKKHGLDYAKNNFSFSLIEHYPLKVDDSYVLARESHWKDILLTRKFGYNDN